MTSSLLGPLDPLSGLNLSPLVSCNSKSILTLQNNTTKDINLSFIFCDEEDICFSKEDLASGQQEWWLSIVGHAIEKRPFYGSLLATIKKKWAFKSNLKLLTMEGDFFLFKISCADDYELVWNFGPCFLNDKLFFLKKWLQDFRSVKEKFSEILSWIKFPNLSLCCWNEKGFSKIANKVGIPLTVGSLTASKSRITFTRVCVQISPSSPLPDEISLNLNGTKWK